MFGFFIMAYAYSQCTVFLSIVIVIAYDILRLAAPYSGMTEFSYLFLPVLGLSIGIAFFISAGYIEKIFGSSDENHSPPCCRTLTG